MYSSLSFNTHPQLTVRYVLLVVPASFAALTASVATVLTGQQLPATGSRQCVVTPVCFGWVLSCFVMDLLESTQSCIVSKIADALCIDRQHVVVVRRTQDLKSGELSIPLAPLAKALTSRAFTGAEASATPATTQPSTTATASANHVAQVNTQAWANGFVISSHTWVRIGPILSASGWFWSCHGTFGMLPHWGRVTLTCVSELTIIGSDNGLLPGRRKPFSEPMLEYC